jgi:hypothetical protein
MVGVSLHGIEVRRSRVRFGNSSADELLWPTYRSLPQPTVGYRSLPQITVAYRRLPSGACGTELALTLAGIGAYK